MISSDSITGWSKVKATIAASIAGLFAEEEVVAVRPGAVTVRPFGTDDDGLPLPPVEYRTLGHVVASPGDHALVLRLPFLKLVLGTITIRGVSRPFPIPFGGYHGRYGTETTAARVDHTHSTEDHRPFAQMWHGWVPFETPNTATYDTVGTREIELPRGTWSLLVSTDMDVWRSVDSGQLWFRIRVRRKSTGNELSFIERNRPGETEKSGMRGSLYRHPLVTITGENDGILIDVLLRGGPSGTGGLSYARQVNLYGYAQRVGVGH